MDEKLINRRSFFKKAATAALPIIAAVTVPSLLTSCEIDEPYVDGGSSSSCNGSCKNHCGNCSQGCTSSCKGTCTFSCDVTCKGSCKRTVNKR